MRRVLLPLLGVALCGALALSQWAPHDPIYIFGDEDFTWENGVVGGSGTPDDPYVIEGWVIDTLGYDYGIYIDNTTAHFVIRNCVIRYPQEKAGIFLSAVKNGVIEGSAIWGGRVAIQLLATSEVTIRGNAIGYCDYGIIVSTGSNDNLIYGNSIVACGLPARDEGLNNRWYHEGKGNYWSDYRGVDLDGDGIGDSSYEVVPDRFPLMEPPVELPPEARPMRTVDLSQVEARGIVALAPGSLVRLSAVDVGVGVDKIFYRLEGKDWQVYSEPFPLEGAAVVRMEYYAVDKLGNREPTKTLTIYLDAAPPVTRIVPGDPHYYAPDGKLWATSHTPFELTAEDDSGVAHIFYRIDQGKWRAYEGPFYVPGPEGPHIVEYYSIDLYGNREAVQSVVVWKDDSAPETTSALQEKEAESPFEETPAPGPEAPEPAPQTGPAPGAGTAGTPMGFVVSLVKVESVENTGVGSDWSFAVSLDGLSMDFSPESLPITIYEGRPRELTVEFRATEADQQQDDVGVGTITLTPPWSPGARTLEVWVYEDNVQTAAKRALWRFTLMVEGK